MGKSLKRFSLYFTGPGCVEVRQEAVPSLQPDQVLIQTLYSAISPGTELLVYRQQVSVEQPLDSNIRSLSGNFQFPLKYGYSAIGKIISQGEEVNPTWNGKTVVTFHPHESLFTACLDEVIPVPADISPMDALFLPNMETAINFVMDGQPILGEKVIVLGQGIVGLLTTSILSQFPLQCLLTLDPIPLRRQTSQRLGARFSLDPGSEKSWSQIRSLLRDEYSGGADLTYEISGNPQALNSAIELTGFDGRILVGSWYGTKSANLRLGETFHRNRIRLISSQVSTIAPSLLGRWNKSRRFQTVWRMIEKIRPSQLISRHFQLTQASEAYRILDENPQEVIQIIFDYQNLQEDHV